MLLPHHGVDQDRQDLADVADDGEAGGRDDGAQGEGEVAHAQAAHAGQQQRRDARGGQAAGRQDLHLAADQHDAQHRQRGQRVLRRQGKSQELGKATHPKP